MRHAALALSALIALVAAAAPARAETHIHEKAKIQLWTPDKWPVETSEDMVVVTHPQDECAVVFMVLAAKDLETALGALDTELEKFVKNVEPQGEAEEIEINGMQGVVIDAKGKIEGKRVDLGLLVLKTPTGKMLLMLAICQSDKVKKHEPTFMRMMKSLKPAPKKFG